MRHVRIYSLSLLLGGLGSLSGGTVAAVAGCALECGDYVDCTSRPGLRYVDCGGRQYEFNDGRSFESKGAALDYCYCGEELLECDVAGVFMCNSTPLNGKAIVVYDNNTTDPLEDGVALCRGYDSCEIETSGCAYEGWYMRCIDGAQIVYVTAQAKVTVSIKEAQDSCSVDGATFRCAEAVDDCSELEDCSVSVACRDIVDGLCSSSILCGLNDDEQACSADPACKWEMN